MSTPSRLVPGSRARTLLGVVAAGSVVWLAGLLADHVDAPAADPSRTDCGSLPTVLRTQSGYGGGEMRADQAAFDQRCVTEAHQRLWTSIVPGLGLVGSAGALTAARRRARHAPRAVAPFR